MQRHFVATLAVVFGCWGMSVEAAMIAGGHGAMNPVIGTQLSSAGPGSSIHLVADTLVAIPADEPTDEPVDEPIDVRVNTGYCQSDPPKWKYVNKNQSLYFYEFCDYPIIDNNLKMDVHKKPASGGEIGVLKTKQLVACSTYYPWNNVFALRCCHGFLQRLSRAQGEM